MYTVHKIRICIVYEAAFIARSKAVRCAANAIGCFIQQRVSERVVGAPLSKYKNTPPRNSTYATHLAG